MAINRLLLCSTVLMLLASAASAQKIQNWTAPPYWAPPSAVPTEDGDGLAAGRQVMEDGTPGIAADDALPSQPAPFVAVSPCRVADTRDATFPAGYGPPALTAGVAREFTISGRCTIPLGAIAVSANLTATNTLGSGFILAYPSDGGLPLVSTLNFGIGQTVANAAVIPLSSAGALTIVAGVAGTDLIIDVNGYYSGAGVVTSLNSLRGSVTLAGSTNVTVTPSGNTLTLALGGAAGGDLTGTYPSPTLATTSVNQGTYGSSGGKVAGFTVDAKGRITNAAERTLAASDVGALGATAGAGGDLSGNYPNPSIAAGSVTGGTVGKIAISTVTAANLAAGDFSTKINAGTYSISISGNAATATSATTAGNVTGTVAVANGGTGATSFTTGGVLFKGATALQVDATKLVWDNTNSRLAVGVSAPSATLHVKGEQDSIRIEPYGATSGQTGELRFMDQTATPRYVGLRAPAAIGTNPGVVWTLPAADGSVGQVLKTDGTGSLGWQTASTGTVTSVGLTAPSIFNSPVSGSPITSSGTLGLTLATQLANVVFAGPTTGAAAAPTFRALVSADLPTVPVTKGGTGTATGSITGTASLTFTASGAAGDVNLVPAGTGQVVVSGGLSHTGTLGFFGKTPTTQQTGLTPAAGALSVTPQSNALGLGNGEWTALLDVIANLQARVNELEAKLSAYGLLP